MDISENGKVSSVLTGLIPSILGKYNTVNIDYTISDIAKKHNIIIQLKTLFGLNFKLAQVNKVIDTKNNVVSINKKRINSELIHSVENIFHTYNDDTGFISYDKYNHKINDIITIDTGRIVSVEKNNRISIAESYNSDITFKYLEYLFVFEHDIEVSLQQYLYDVEHFRLHIHIPINEEKHISSDKLEYINLVCNKIELLVSES